MYVRLNVNIITFMSLIFRTTIYTEYTVFCKNHIDAGDTQIKTRLSYNHYLQAWYSFVCLLDIDYSQGYTCRYPFCVDIVIMVTSLCKHTPNVMNVYLYFNIGYLLNLVFKLKVC